MSAEGAPAGRSAEVNAFLAELPEPARVALEELRRLIAAAAPEAVEAISYGVPAFKYRGRPLVSFGAGKSGRGHLAFYVQSPTVMEAHRDELRGYDTSKGTVRFSPDRTLPADLVAKLVRARMRETDAGHR
jgi:uncharacterized protein YdhG (YjbR/CyaY superfamily)